MYFKTGLSFLFYRKFILISGILTVFLVLLSTPLEAIILIKFCLLGFIFLDYRFIQSSDKLLFYKNFGITPSFLFVFTSVTDFLLSVFLFKISSLIL